MNREVLYRGKRVDNGEWVEGFYTQLPKASLGATIMADGELCAEDVGVYIIVVYSKQHPNFYDPLEIVEHEIYEVIFETVGEYTGLTDKSGKKIFEGDILADFETGNRYVVKYDEDYAGFGFNNVDGRKSDSFFGKEILDFWNLYNGQFEIDVIGNIHDNPDLMEVK